MLRSGSPITQDSSMRAVMSDGVSVIMPAYNCAHFIHESIASILNQTHVQFELIIVDDGSHDDTARRAEVFEKMDPRVRVIRADHGGISATINRGVAAARFEWIAIMHGDDIALPQRLEKQLAAAKADPSVVAWGAFAQHINARGQRLSISYTGPTTHDEFRRIMANGDDVYVIHPTLFLRKSTLLQVGGYDSRFDGSEDLELEARLSLIGDVLALPEPLVLYRVHSSSMSMRRFFHMRHCARFIQERQRRLAEGKPLEPAEYESQFARLGLLTRMKIGINDAARFCYRRSGLAFGDANLGEGLLLLLSAVFLAPHYSIPRLWRQRLGRRASRELDRPLMSRIGKTLAV